MLDNRDLIVFAVGLAVGGGVTYVILNKHYGELYRKDYEEMQARMKAKGQVKDTDISKPEAQEETKASELPYASDKIVPTENPFPGYELKGVQYGGFVSKETEATEDIPAEDAGVPKIITWQEFADTKLTYGKNELYFYSEDRILTSEDEEVDDHVKDMVGSAALDEVEKTHETVYVRNNRFAEDFCIYYVDGQFYEDNQPW